MVCHICGATATIETAHWATVYYTFPDLEPEELAPPTCPGCIDQVQFEFEEWRATQWPRLPAEEAPDA